MRSIRHLSRRCTSEVRSAARAPNTAAEPSHCPDRSLMLRTSLRSNDHVALPCRSRLEGDRAGHRHPHSGAGEWPAFDWKPRFVSAC